VRGPRAAQAIGDRGHSLRLPGCVREGEGEILSTGANNAEWGDASPKAERRLKSEGRRTTDRHRYKESVFICVHLWFFQRPDFGFRVSDFFSPRCRAVAAGRPPDFGFRISNLHARTDFVTRLGTSPAPTKRSLDLAYPPA